MTTKIRVKLDEDIADLMVRYLEMRKKELEVVSEAIAAGEFSKLENIGHKLKGNAASYGMDGLGEIGGRLEKAARARDRSTAQGCFVEMRGYVECVELY